MQEFDGANITVALKEEALLQADIVSPQAQKIGACNVFVRFKNKVMAHNTDADGFYRSMLDLGDFENVLLLGAGGAARAIATSLEKADIGFVVANRSEQKLEFFQQLQMRTCLYSQIPNEKFDLIVNATSAGLTDDVLPLDEAVLKDIASNSRAFLDIVYGKNTPFLDVARSFGLDYRDGKGMLINQAVESFLLWFEGASRELVFKSMNEALLQN